MLVSIWLKRLLAPSAVHAVLAPPTHPSYPRLLPKRPVQPDDGAFPPREIIKYRIERLERDVTEIKVCKLARRKCGHASAAGSCTMRGGERCPVLSVASPEVLP